MKKSFWITSLSLLLMFISCSDDSDDLFMSKIRGKSFKIIENEEKGENEAILYYGNLLIIIKGLRLELYAEQDNGCWDRAEHPFYLKDNFQYSAWFESVDRNGGLVGVHKREDGGVRIVLWGEEFDAERTREYCIDGLQ